MHQISTQIATNQKNQPDNFDKGKAFEAYIISLFNANSFKLKEWRKSEKFSERFYSPGYSNPDLELIFTGRRNYLFAVECKWRHEFKEGKITWATETQIDTYLTFQYQRNISVFVAIGIGGEPSSPEKLFVTPLNNICRLTEVYESELIPFKRKLTSRFFYDTVQAKLF